MTHQPANRVLETTTTEGTGTYSVDGSPASYQTFADGVGDGNTVDYCAVNNTDWEVGRGTVGTGTISRDTIIASSNSGAAVDWGSGTKNILSVLPSELMRLLYWDPTASTLSLDTGGGNVDLHDGNLVVNNGSDVTLSAAELAYLEGQDQAIGSNDSPTFAGLTVDGNVGIGTTGPEKSLHVEGIIQSGSQSGVDGELLSWQSGGINYVSLKTDSGTKKSGFYRNNVDDFPFYYDTRTGNSVLDATYAGSSVLFNIGDVEKMRVDNSGNVGIGHPFPDTILDINGALTQRPLSADPSDPDDGNSVMWVSDGTGSGLAGDVMMKITVGATTKTVTLVEFATA